MGLKDRDAFVTRGVQAIPHVHGRRSALAALLALLTLAWVARRALIRDQSSSRY